MSDPALHALPDPLPLAFMSMQEWLIILAIVMLLFGATRLPKLARSLGQGITEFKKGLRERPEDEDEAGPPAPRQKVD